MFYNRTSEITILKRALARERKQFVVLYGRRRCGKSTLLRKIILEEDVYFLSSQSDQALQREALTASLKDKIPAINKVNFTNWDVFFDFLNRNTQTRFTLVLDEFPYLVQSAPDLPSIVNRYIDDRERLNFDLIVCGSSQQMMRGLVLKATAPLYGRADEIIKIEPLSAGWLLDHLPDDSPSDLIREHAVWGGVPRYWELRKEYKSLSAALTALVLEPTGVMREEPKRLLLDDMREVTQAISLLTVVSLGANRMSEIAARMHRPASDLSRPLNRLIELGYLEKEFPYGAPIHRTRTTIYKVADSFMRFYFNLVYPRLSNLIPGRIDSVRQDIERRLDLFISEEWERLCRRAVGLHPELIDRGFAPARWWGNGKDGKPFELDAVSLSYDKKYLMVAECKWADVKNPDTLQHELIAKAEQLPFYSGQTIIPVLAAKSFVHSPNCLGLQPIDVLQLLKW